MGEFTTAAVIGAGVMGAGIAAQLADAGLSVTLLDQSETIARQGVDRQLKTGGFRNPVLADAIQTGSVDADLTLLSGADWIVEAAAERLDVKRAILRKVSTVRQPEAIVSSSTSTIPLSRMIEGLDAAYAKNILVTHFFNPPSRMRLLELVSSDATAPQTITKIEDFCSAHLNKVVVRCADTPGFLANRVGTFWLWSALEAAQAFELEVEESDSVLRSPFGAPVGAFAFLDIVGIDLAVNALTTLQKELPPNDALQAFSAEMPLIAEMVRRGRTGRKSGAGFMRKSTTGALEVLDLKSGDYRKAHPPTGSAITPSQENIRAALADDEPIGRFAWRVMSQTLDYAAGLVPSVTHLPELVDIAMREGYGWRQGPFALIEVIGPHILRV